MRSGASRNNVLETINAAATAIASSDDRVHQASPIRKKRKWWNRWSLLICFRSSSSRRRKRIGNAVLAPEPERTNSNSSGYRSVITALPFIAPPSSPASFFQSEPPSATQSPVGILSFSPIPNSNSNNRPSIFAIGPYAHELQLVSPPVFSTYTTEPSSTPITPPLLDESIRTTTPSSPEVPFAQLFNSNGNLQTGNNNRFYPYEFQFYQLPPGSPLGQLISPSSVKSNSGSTSPFPDGETARFSHFQISDPPKLLSPCSSNKIVRPLNKPVSFDLDSDHVIRCVDEKLRTTFPEAATTSSSSNQEVATTTSTNHSSPGSSNKEFNFGTDEKDLSVDDEDKEGSSKNWSFFPVMQSNTTLS